MGNMHDTHLGSHPPPHINQLLMVTEPHNFLHVKDLGDGTIVEELEEGENNFTIHHSVMFQKYWGKKQPYEYIGYDHSVNLRNDSFLASFSKKEKQRFTEEMKKMWNKKKHMLNAEDVWYMIVEGKNRAGQSRVAMYQDERVFLAKRDEDFKLDTQKYWSAKAFHFEDLNSAKFYVQMSRDEDGRHWKWPKDIPVIWKTGPFSATDREQFPRAEEYE